MKTLNKICQILCIVFGLVASALFFMKFATLIVNGHEETFVGTFLAFGATKKITGDVVATIGKSSDILLCFLLTVIGFIMSIFSFKKKGLRYAVSAFSLDPAIYMLVITLSNPWEFVDHNMCDKAGNVLKVTGVKYTSFVGLTCLALFIFAGLAIAYLLIDDSIEVAESKGKKTIIKRIGLFFRDYKSEVKKIVWPSFKDVVKNTVIVLVMCLLVGILIWLLDWGLGSLIKVILNVK